MQLAYTTNLMLLKMRFENAITCRLVTGHQPPATVRRAVSATLCQPCLMVPNSIPRFTFLQYEGKKLTGALGQYMYNI